MTYVNYVDSICLCNPSTLCLFVNVLLLPINCSNLNELQLFLYHWQRRVISLHCSTTGGTGMGIIVNIFQAIQYKGKYRPHNNKSSPVPCSHAVVASVLCYLPANYIWFPLKSHRHTTPLDAPIHDDDWQRGGRALQIPDYTLWCDDKDDGQLQSEQNNTGGNAAEAASTSSTTPRQLRTLRSDRECSIKLTFLSSPHII